YPGVATRVEVLGDRGSAIVENDEMGFFHLARDEEEPSPDYGLEPGRRPAAGAGGTSSSASAVLGDTHALQIADMIRAIREDGTPLVDGHAGRHPVEIILGIYESARSGAEVLLM